MSTTIYQVHEMSGEYEDYEDIIKGLYFKKSDAEKLIETLKQQIKAEEIKLEKCQNCPSHKFDSYNKNNIKEIEQYCNEFELIKDEYDGDYCNNEIFDIDEVPTYEIVEEEIN